MTKRKMSAGDSLSVHTHAANAVFKAQQPASIPCQALFDFGSNDYSSIPSSRRDPTANSALRETGTSGNACIRREEFCKGSDKPETEAAEEDSGVEQWARNLQMLTLHMQVSQQLTSFLHFTDTQLLQLGHASRFRELWISTTACTNALLNSVPIRTAVGFNNAENSASMAMSNALPLQLSFLDGFYHELLASQPDWPGFLRTTSATLGLRISPSTGSQPDDLIRNAASLREVVIHLLGPERKSFDALGGRQWVQTPNGFFPVYDSPSTSVTKGIGTGQHMRENTDGQVSRPSPALQPLHLTTATQQNEDDRILRPVHQEDSDDVTMGFALAAHAALSRNSVQANAELDVLPSAVNQDTVDSTKEHYDRVKSVLQAKAEERRNDKTLISNRRPWSPAEETALMTGLDKVKGPHWSQILAMYGAGGTVSEILKDRNQVQLKDKARNIKMFFLKMGYEVPPYLRSVTGDLSTRAPAKVAKNAAQKQLEENSSEDRAASEAISILTSI